MTDQPTNQSYQPTYRPRRQFWEVDTVTAQQLGIKNITLYPNADPRISQYVNVDFPNYHDDDQYHRTNVLFQKFPEKVNLKDINLDLERGYVVSQNYQPKNTQTPDTKPTLSESSIGRQVTLEYLHEGKVSRTYTGELVRQEGTTYYLRESGGALSGYNLRILRKPDDVVYHSFSKQDAQKVEQLNPTEKVVTPAAFKIQVKHWPVATDQSQPDQAQADQATQVEKPPTDQVQPDQATLVDTQAGLFHYNSPGLDWNLYSCATIAMNDQADVLESFAIYADIKNQTGLDFQNIENMKFIMAPIQTVPVYSYSDRSSSFISAGSNNTSSSYYNIIGHSLTNANRQLRLDPPIPKANPQLKDNGISTGYAMASMNSIDTVITNASSLTSCSVPVHENGQKHLAGIGTFTVYDVTELKNDATTSVLFYRDVDIPFNKIYEKRVSEGGSLTFERMDMRVEITRDQHKRLASFIPTSHILVKARHPDDSLVHLADSTSGPVYQNESVSFPAGYCDEIRLTQYCQTDDHYEDYQEHTWHNDKCITHNKKRIKQKDFHYQFSLTNRSIRDRTIDLIVPSLLPLNFEGEQPEDLEVIKLPSGDEYRVRVPVEKTTVRDLKVTGYRTYSYPN